MKDELERTGQHKTPRGAANPTWVRRREHLTETKVK